MVGNVGFSTLSNSTLSGPADADRLKGNPTESQMRNKIIMKKPCPVGTEQGFEIIFKIEIRILIF
jgi:hypothetical protein